MPFPTSQANIQDAERTLRRALPRALRERLARDNGGEVAAGDEGHWQLHPVWDETDRRTMARTTSHLVSETEVARRWERFPEGAIAIANNGTGDLLVLCTGSDDVQLWDHETGACSPVSVDWA